MTPEEAAWMDAPMGPPKTPVLCECGVDYDDHAGPLGLDVHDQFMRKATIARLRKRLQPHQILGGSSMSWVWVDAILTDEEVGR